MAGIELSQSLAIVAEYTRDGRQSAMTMLHLIGSKGTKHQTIVKRKRSLPTPLTIESVPISSYPMSI
jgi:hypothetical protein